MSEETIGKKERNRQYQTVGHYLEWYPAINTFHGAENETLGCSAQSAPGWNEKTVVPDEWADKMTDLDLALRNLTFNQMTELVEHAMPSYLSEEKRMELYGTDEPDDYELGSIGKLIRPEFLNEQLPADKADLVWDFVIQLYYGELSEMLNC